MNLSFLLPSVFILFWYLDPPQEDGRHISFLLSCTHPKWGLLPHFAPLLVGGIRLLEKDILERAFKSLSPQLSLPCCPSQHLSCIPSGVTLPTRTCCFQRPQRTAPLHLPFPSLPQQPLLPLFFFFPIISFSVLAIHFTCLPFYLADSTLTFPLVFVYLFIHSIAAMLVFFWPLQYEEHLDKWFC